MRNFAGKNKPDKKVWGVLGKQETYYSPEQFQDKGRIIPLNANPLEAWDASRSRYIRRPQMPPMPNDGQQGGVVGTSGPAPTPTPTATVAVTPTPTGTAAVTPTPTTTVTPTNTTTNTPTQSSTPSMTPSMTPSPSAPASGTTEALLYLNRVVQSGGTVDATASAATITLFTSLVSNGLYNKLDAFYPVLGGVAASHTINAPSPSGLRDLTFVGGWTHSASGMQPNGTNGYADTNLNPNSVIGDGNTSHLSVYVNLQGTGDRIYDMGVATSDTLLTDMLNITAKRSAGASNNTLFDAGTYDPSAFGRVSTTSQASASGMTVGSVRSSTDRTLYRNGSNIATQTGNRAITYANRTLIIGAQQSNIISYWSNNRYAFVTIGRGLTNTDIVNLSNIINTYQTSLGRNTY